MRTQRDFKVIGVGLPKTGTTSFGDACEIFGLSRLKWDARVHGTMTIRCHEGDFSVMKDQIDKVDVVEDMPFCSHYEWIAQNYPTAKFVLTKRQSPQIWLRSLENHLRSIPRWVGVFLTFGCYEVPGHEEALIELYERHNDRVEQYMRLWHRELLVLTMGEEGNMERLSEFLDLPLPQNASFPLSNKATY